jgi:hypothetical protein
MERYFTHIGITLEGLGVSHSVSAGSREMTVGLHVRQWTHCALFCRQVKDFRAVRNNSTAADFSFLLHAEKSSLIPITKGLTGRVTKN